MKYYKTNLETIEYGEGFYYCEVIENEIQRQIMELNGTLYWATLYQHKDERFDFTDQPEMSEEEVKVMKENFEGLEISKDHFETLWEKSKQ